MKKCVLILPYFGKFNNYFQLFLNSCAYNKNYHWLIITDSLQSFMYPVNCTVVRMSFNECKEHIQDKFDFEIRLEKPYKLCDYKPAYGYIFEEYIYDYDYWGHCDNDIIFGDMSKFLNHLLEQDFDKLFAAGHLTLYKNTPENNRCFMNNLNGEKSYKTVYQSDEIFAFDEDFQNFNVHRIFQQQGKHVYGEDFSLNPYIFTSRLQMKSIIRLSILLNFSHTNTQSIIGKEENCTKLFVTALN